MGRKEGEYEWKKSTDNIQDVFDFMDVLGSWVIIYFWGLFAVKAFI